MAVLVEAISVIIRADALRDKFPGGLDAFMTILPNRTFCFDGELARIGFMTPQDVNTFVVQLEQAGLVYMREGKTVDLSVVDQHQGPFMPGDWLQFGHVNINGTGGRVAACRLAGSQSHVINFPDDWKFEGSLSDSGHFVPNQDIGKNLEFLRSENGVDVYLNKTTGKEVYTGRTDRRNTG